ncbi:unnamed protein product [Closterium sp. Naga37s-1]|nr:unnamed protein product [Closterium sp. Naga37s-1]
MRRIRRLRAVWDGGGVEQRRCGGMPRKWQGGRRVEGINARGRGRRHGGGRVLSAVVLALVGGVLHGGRAWRGGALGMGGSADDASGGSEHARALYRVSGGRAAALSCGHSRSSALVRSVAPRPPPSHPTCKPHALFRSLPLLALPFPAFPFPPLSTGRARTASTPCRCCRRPTSLSPLACPARRTWRIAHSGRRGGSAWRHAGATGRPPRGLVLPRAGGCRSRHGWVQPALYSRYCMLLYMPAAWRAAAGGYECAAAERHGGPCMQWHAQHTLGDPPPGALPLRPPMSAPRELRAAMGGLKRPPRAHSEPSGTREAQRDIWEQQFPAACAGRRLVVVPWLNVASFGLGAQLHVVSAILAAALLHNRTLVMLPHSMAHADHAHCEAVGERGSLSCYFFPMAARECEAVAMAAYHSAAMLKCDNSSVLVSPAPVVFGCGPKLGQDSAVVGRWGEAYKEREVVQEVEGALYARMDDKIRKKHWWRAQSVRFMLRWPSRHLCHLINRERHTAYGMHVAAQLAAAAHQAALLSMLLSSKPHSHPAAFASPPSSSPPSPSPSPPAPLALTGMPSIPPPSALESHAWPLLGYDACDDATAASATLTAALPPDPAPAVPAPSPAAAPGDAPPLPPEQWSAAEAAVLVGGAVHMPRPVVSVHVRQGDKAREMRLFSFFAFMHRANRLRRLDPNLKAVWLSTEMQSVVEQTALFPDWTFYYSRLPRQGAREAMANYSTATGLATVVGASFANLLIASECDYFVGTLGSNWNRLINELKSTNGRLFSGYVSLNFGEW